MTKHTFIYVTYIKSSADKVFRALTEPEFTKLYWGNHHNASDWKVGSEWRHEDFDDKTLVDVVGTVIENAPPSRLVLSWARPAEKGDPDKHARVAFDIVEDKGLVRLTVTHDELDESMAKGISGGWPMVLASLKTMLETGSPMPEVKTRINGKWHTERFAS